ncbi:MAG: hypothetical protein NVV66_10085 [Cellulomonas sp.]|uniref:hypothetical protein n=1 Tax=Cellulomonas sp. TaxID=40001 RepID=UPI00258ADB52|nr:hypothetical protein [Cellulomonas sp.]MCR6705021.1 hypothetical protein [Cellulomonas sp.]
MRVAAGFHVPAFAVNTRPTVVVPLTFGIGADVNDRLADAGPAVPSSITIIPMIAATADAGFRSARARNLSSAMVYSSRLSAPGGVRDPYVSPVPADR